MPKKTVDQHGSSKKSKGIARAYFQLYRYAQPFDYLLLGLGTICALAGGVPLPLIGVVFGELINDFSSQFRTIDDINRLSSEQIASFKQAIHTEVLYLIYIAIGYFIVTYVYTVCWSTLGERMTRQIRIHYLAAVLEQEIAYFETVGSGEVSNRITGDTQTIQNGTSEKVGLCLQSASYFIAAFIVGFVKDAKLTGIMFSVVPAIFIVITGSSHYIAKNTEKASSSQSDASTFSQDALTNIRVSQAFSLQERLGKALNEFLEKAFKYGCRKALWAALMLGSIFWVAYSANALAFWEGGRIILSEQAGNVGAVYTVVFLVLDSSFVVGQISPFLQTFSLAAGAGIKLFAAIDRTPEISITNLKENTIQNFKGSIELEDVRFAYPSSTGQEVLKGVNMKFLMGKTTAIVGVSGSGKSTIVSLMERFYDPTGGTIYFDGHSTKELSLAWLRSQIGLVTQMPTLFNTSILENIAYGYTQLDLAQEISAEKLKDLCILAAQQANAHEFVSRLPNGYNTKAGEGGIALSGGQKQRIALARAIISNPKVLILDEATSALDAASEAIVQEALERVAAERTTIVIAHRLSTIRNADNIIVMADGVVLEEGTHEQLVSKHGAYHTMVQSQQHSQSDNNGQVTEPSISECSISEKISLKSNDEKCSSSETIISFDDDGSTKRGFEPPLTTASAKPMSTLMVLQRMIMICRPELPWIILGLATSAIIGGSTCAEALLFAHIVSALSMTDTPDLMRSQVAYFSMWFFIVAIVLFFAYCINGTAFGYVSEHLQNRIRKLAFVSVLRQDISWHDAEEHSPSALIASLNTDAALLGGLSSTVIGTIFSVLINMSAGITLAHIVAWKIAVVILAAVPVMIVAGWLRIKVIADLHTRHATAYVRSASLASEAVSSIQTIASLGREKDICKLYEQAIQAPYEDSIKSLLKGNAWLSLGYSITYLMYALAYWWGSQLLSRGEYTSTQFFIVLPALLFSAQASGQMFSLAPDVTKAKMAAGRIFELIELQPTIDVRSDQNSILACTGKPGQVTFENVHFRYESRREAPVLQGLDLQINAGQFVALVGESGCGKTTALSLLERFYDVNQGSLSVDGLDVRSYEVHQLRSQIALVSQEPILYSGSVSFNVLLGSEVIQSIEDVHRVCKLANIHEEIMNMPQGYDTEVGFRGSKLSGGQRQRVAIARALMRNPKILLLDEATSALDSQNERLVQDALNKAAEGRTTIAIAHRLSTIRRADRIFVIDGGRVVEQGTHEELLAKRSKYYTLFQHQTLSSEVSLK